MLNGVKHLDEETLDDSAEPLRFFPSVRMTLPVVALFVMPFEAPRNIEMNRLS